MDFQGLAEKAADIIDNVEGFQWTLGELANEVVEKHGYKALEDFSKQIETITGHTRAPETLRMYAHVWKVATKLDLPKDLLFSVNQKIVFSQDPTKYAKMAKSGSTSQEILYAIQKDEA